MDTNNRCCLCSAPLHWVCVNSAGIEERRTYFVRRAQGTYSRDSTCCLYPSHFTCQV